MKKVELVGFNMRMPVDILDDLEAIVERVNSNMRVGKVTRSDIVKLMLREGIDKMNREEGILSDEQKKAALRLPRKPGKASPTGVEGQR